MSTPILLDLFCKAGGCSAGYVRAGFEVVGVDIEPQLFPVQQVSQACIFIFQFFDAVKQMIDAGMVKSMSLFVENAEILQAIILLVMIMVMDFFERIERPSQETSHYDAMFVSVSVLVRHAVIKIVGRHPNFYITTLCYAPSALPIVVSASGTCSPAGRSGKFCCATSASQALRLAILEKNPLGPSAIRTGTPLVLVMSALSDISTTNYVTQIRHFAYSFSAPSITQKGVSGNGYA